MRLIIIEDKAYRVKEEVYNQLIQRRDLADKGTWQENRQAIMDLEYYIENVAKKQKCLGFIFFDYRI